MSLEMCLLSDIKPEGILFLVDSAETKDRVLALNILGQLLSNIYGLKSNILPNIVNNSSLKASITFAILTRCDDISPVVRSKALVELSQNIKCILNFFVETINQGGFEYEDSEHVKDMVMDRNGVHRFFWYDLMSSTERWIEFQAVLQRRLGDDYAVNRKTALLVLEKTLMFDHTCITKENLKCFEAALKDASILVRTQVIQSLSGILNAYPENSLIQEYWLKCILPLIQDNEISVQTAVLLAVEDQFLRNIFSPSDNDRIIPLNLLKKLSSGNLLFYHRFLKRTFSLWKDSDMLRPEMVASLVNYVETEYEECIWFYLSCFAFHCPLPRSVSRLCLSRIEIAEGSGGYPFLEHTLKVALHVIESLDLETLDTVQRAISEGLRLFLVPVEFIPAYTEILFKIHKHRATVSEFERFSSQIIQECQDYLTTYQLNEQSNVTDELVVKCFCNIRELCQLCPSNLTPSLFAQAFSGYIQESTSISACLKAHAYAALGKMCLQNEYLAKELFPVFAKEMVLTEEDVIRNNIVIIVIGICKRYAFFADKCIPLFILCFNDKNYLVRYQTIVLLTDVLQDGYIKWQGPLFFCFLSTLVEKNKAIREIGRYNLSQFLHDKASAFSDHFIGSIFVFNDFALPDNEVPVQSMKYLERIAIPGENRRWQRMVLYRFLLESMSNRDKSNLIKSISEVIMSVAESMYSPNEKTECIVRDCFAILSCIRVLNLHQSGNVNEAASNEFSAEELKARRAVVDPVIPAIISLKNYITDPKSDLVFDMILFLKEFLSDFKEDLKCILAENTTLLRQLELEFKNDAEKERRKVVEENLQEKIGQSAVENTEKEMCLTLQGFQAMINDSGKHLQDLSSTTMKPKQSSDVYSDQKREIRRYNLRPLPSRMKNRMLSM